MSDGKRIPVDVLAQALRPGAECPEPERLIGAAAGELPGPERERILAHAAGCAACAAELELFASYRRQPAAEEAADLEWIAQRLAAAPVAGPAPIAKVLPMRLRRTAGAPRRWTLWAAAASAVLAVGLSLWVVRDGVAPALPDRPAADVVRGGSIAWTTPLGTLPEAPVELAWEAVPGAARYRVEVVDVAGRTRLEATPEAPRWKLDGSERARFETFVLYRVRVSAFDAAGRELAASEAADLRLEPAR